MGLMMNCEILYPSDGHFKVQLDLAILNDRASMTILNDQRNMIMDEHKITKFPLLGGQWKG